MKRLTRSEEGQAVVEYVLLLAVIVGAYVLAARGLGQFNFMARFSSIIGKRFAAAYQLGDVQAEDIEGGSGKRHPRAIGKPESFRIFISPEVK